MMNKLVRKLFDAEARKTAERFSDRDRANNVADETYHIAETYDCSETICAVVFQKQPSEQRALYVMKWINAGKRVQGDGDRSWVVGWFPNYADFMGLRLAEQFLIDVEMQNTKTKATT